MTAESDHYKERKLEYEKCSMFEAVERHSKNSPNLEAYIFFGKKVTYAQFVSDITECAKSLKTYGVRPGDRVTVALPNCPQAMTVLYAINMVGAIANMVHPLSGEKEFKEYIDISGSKIVFTLDQFYLKFKNIMPDTCLETIVVTRIQDGLSTIKGLLYSIKAKNKLKEPLGEGIITWKGFLKSGKTFIGECHEKVDAMDPAIILYSGGTTGKTKGVLHCNDAFNALAAQIGYIGDIGPGVRILSVLPMFHGFGLGVSIHSFTANGMTCVLLPQFYPDEYLKTLSKEKCGYMIGPPTLFEALTKCKDFDNTDLSCVIGAYIGGDTISPERERAIVDKFIKNGSSRPRQGYGLAESIAVVTVIPRDTDRVGSIGKPIFGNRVEIFKVDSTEPAETGELGEICVHAPTNMLGYYNNKEETEKVLKVHPDGLTWVHTGDLGTMDNEGYITYVQRIKRMIITNGYNVYPSQMESILDESELVKSSCIVGIPDERKGHAIKAFVVLSEGVEKSEITKELIRKYLKQNFALYAKPYDIEFRDEFPLTPMKKIDYRKLEKEEIERLESLKK